MKCSSQIHLPLCKQLLDLIMLVYEAWYFKGRIWSGGNKSPPRIGQTKKLSSSLVIFFFFFFGLISACSSIFRCTYKQLGLNNRAISCGLMAVFNAPLEFPMVVADVHGWLRLSGQQVCSSHLSFSGLLASANTCNNSESQCEDVIAIR